MMLLHLSTSHLPINTKELTGKGTWRPKGRDAILPTSTTAEEIQKRDASAEPKQLGGWCGAIDGLRSVESMQNSRTVSQANAQPGTNKNKIAQLVGNAHAKRYTLDCKCQYVTDPLCD
jgi:hypothetical protein